MAGKSNGVGVILKEQCIRNVLEVKRVSDRVMGLKLQSESVVFSVWVLVCWVLLAHRWDVSLKRGRNTGES